MNKKLLTIQILKQRISNMQQQLNKLQDHKNNSHSKSPVKSRQISQQKSPNNTLRKTSSNLRYRSPTFWTGNTLLAQQNPYFSAKSISPSPKAKRKQNAQKLYKKSPILEKIQKDIDISFYQSAPVNEARQREKQNLEVDKPTAYFGKRYEHRFFEYCRPDPKIQKKKTFELPRKDPILNPQPIKPEGRKISVKPSLSPQNMLIESPDSNPNIYFFNSTQPITLASTPKGSTYKNRNNSPDLKLLLSNSAENLRDINNKTPKSNKKHYGRYVEQNFASKWNVGW